MARTPGLFLVAAENPEDLPSGHAHIRLTGSGVELIDTRSKNGTRINGAALPPDSPRPLAVNDTVHFGTVLVVLADAAALYAMLA